MPAEIVSGSLQYVLVPVANRVSGASVAPTSLDVEMAFTTGETPEDADFVAATWETDTTTTPDTYSARCLVGPTGTTDLDAGAYTVWVRVTAAAETPILKAGLLRVI